MGTEWLVDNHMEVLNVVRFQKFRMNGDTRMCSHYQRRKKETLQVNMRNLTLSSKLKMLGVYYIICDVIITESRGEMGVWLKKILKICSEVSFFLIKLKIESNLLLLFFPCTAKANIKFEFSELAMPFFFLWNYHKTQSSNSSN